MELRAGESGPIGSGREEERNSRGGASKKAERFHGSGSWKDGSEEDVKLVGG
jgi:hypothetical protein